MKQLFYTMITLVAGFACAILPKGELAEETLFTIDSNPTLADEFLYVYEKNNFNNDSIYTEKDIDEYFELFLNFKLKVAAAKTAGLDTSEAFLNEFGTYKDQLVKPYLSESKEQEKQLLETYERMKFEIDASHILISIAENASPDDTVTAYQKMREVYEKATSGEDFSALATEYSEDPSAKSNQGSLGYFTVFQMVYAFEEAAYSTPVDSISDIIRSRFGYHILKVHDKRPFSGKVKVSHIMLRVDPAGGEVDSAKNKIFEIHDQAKGGADWNDLCARYSDDQRTKNSGGTLPLFGLKQIGDEAFENAAFSLESPGEISDPVQSRFGWHILRLEEKEGLRAFDEMKGDLEKQISRDGRMQLSRKTLIAKLKSENNYVPYPQTQKELLEKADSSLISGTWSGNRYEQLAGDTLFTLNGKAYKVSSAVDYVEAQQQRKPGVSPETYMSELLDAYTEQSLLSYEEEQLVATNRDFRMLLNEYYEGILLFEIMDKQVWTRAVQDTAGQKQYYHDNLQKYYWGERVAASVISAEDESIIHEVKQLIDQGHLELLAMTLDVSQRADFMTDPSLDTLTKLAKRYEQSQIIMYSSDSLRKTDAFRSVRAYFNDLGIPDQEVRVMSGNDYSKKIGLVINSKSKKSLEYLYNKESELNLQVDEGKFEIGDNQLLDSITWESGSYEFFDGSRHYLVVIDEILKPGPKELKDVKGLVISDYQNYLEQNWIRELRGRYEVDINMKTLEKIKKAYRKKLTSAV